MSITNQTTVESSSWRDYAEDSGTDMAGQALPDDLLQAIREARDAVPLEPELTPHREGHMYTGTLDKAHNTYLRQHLSSRAESAVEAERRKVRAFLALQAREGNTAAINTYDDQIVTWGTGWSGLALLGSVMERAVSSPSVRDALDRAGVRYRRRAGKSTYDVVDLATGKVVTGREASLKVIRASAPLLCLLIDLARSTETRDAVTEAQLATFLGNSGKIEGAEAIATQALFNFIAHLQHWLSGYVTGCLAWAVPQVGGEPSPERDKKLAPLVGRYFYGKALRAKAKPPSWKQFRTYFQQHLKEDGLDCSMDPFIQAATPPLDDPFVAVPLPAAPPKAAAPERPKAAAPAPPKAAAPATTSSVPRAQPGAVGGPSAPSERKKDTMAVTTLSPISRAGGLLLNAFNEKTIDEIQWTEVTLGDLVITVASDALKAKVLNRSGVRLPVSYTETVTICRALGCVAPTKAMADAMFAQAKAQLNFVGLVRTAADSAKMATVDFTLRFNDGVQKQLPAGLPPGSLLAGAWKYWILHPWIDRRGAVNYGFWDKSKKPPVTIQTPGGMHNAAHYDYSQLLQPVKRMAKKAATGEEVDLLEYIAATEKVPQKYLDVFNPELPLSFDIYDEDVNLVSVLTEAGVTVKPADGWENKGREGFAPEGIMVHHTAGPKMGDAPTLPVCIQGRPDLPGPLCHIFLSRSGTAHVLAANITNHAGKGAQGVLDLVKKDESVTGNAASHKYADAIGGNTFFYGIEVENSGTEKDPYPPAQIDALSTICAAICSSRKWSAARVIHHRQWTARKIDMSFRGDLPGLVAQKMDAGAVSFGMDEDPTEPMWEPDPDSEAS